MSETQAAPPAPTPQFAPAKASNGLAIAGFVLGLLGFLGSFIPLINIVGIVMGVVGAVLAAVGLAKAKKSGTGKGLAMSGLILGGLALIIGIAVNVAFANVVSNAGNDVAVATSSNSADPAATSDAATGDAAVGTSRDNPAPLGSAITAGDWTVTINSVTTAATAKFDQAPAAGKTLLVINVTATYKGNDSQGSTAWANVKFVTADGTTIDSTSGSTMFIPEDQFDSLTTLYEGASVTGNKMLEVPAEGWQKGVLAVSPDLFSDDTFVAVQ